MLSVFNNLPGIYVYKDDGNLRIIESIPSDVSLVVGTAPDGPSGLYLVPDTGTAESLYDPTYSKEGTLLKGMYEVFENGAKFVALFRVGSSPAAVDFLNGYTIVTKEANSEAGSLYKVFYTNDYNSSGQEVLRVYDAKTGNIVYDSYANIDTGAVSVHGAQFLSAAQKSITIGNDVSTWQSSPSLASMRDFTNASYAIGDPQSITLVSGTKTFTTSSDYFKAGQIVNIDSSDDTDDGTYEISYVTKSGATYTVAVSKKVSYSNGEVSEVAFSSFATGTGTAQLAVKYIDAKTGIGLKENEYFLELARAYWELESAKVNMVFPAGVHMDTPNVVDNEGRYRADQTGYAGVPSGDYLGKVYEFEHAGNIFMAFKNSFSSDSDLQADSLPTPYELNIDGFAAKAWLEGTHEFNTAVVCASDADITNASDDIHYSEANYAYQLAFFLHNLSVNDNEASGVIGVVPPKNFARSGVSTWIGKAPTKSSNGNILSSGSGLLGYKFKSGSAGVSEGFFLTSNGYVDGTAILDRNQQKVDIGKYIDITSVPLLIRSSYSGGSTGYLSPGAGAYAGLLMSLPKNVSTTNKTLKGNVSLPFSLHKKYQDQLVGMGYVVFGTAPNNNVRVIASRTAALETSDWRFRLTNTIVSSVVERVREIGNPYIGGITSPQIMMSLEEEINTQLKEFQNPQDKYLLGGKATVRQSRDMAIKGEAAVQLILYVPGELRRITVYVTLSK